MLAFAWGMGLQELLIALGIALLLFGGKRLPAVRRGLGRSLIEFRRALSSSGQGDDASPS